MNEVMTNTNCYHCGDECKPNEISLDEKHFCCHGCKTVFEILSENDLCDYYSLEQSPGASQKEKSGLFDFLDNEEVKRSLLDFADGHVEKVTFFIPNIHCSSCIWLLEHLERLEESVIQSTVNFTKRRVTIQYERENFSLRALAELLQRIGYAPMISLEQEEKQVVEDKSLWIKLGIAGFCFGNVMLLSFPEYLGLSGLEEQYQNLFRWMSVGLSLPVVFYAASDYFISAFKSIRQKFINIDVPIALGVIALFLRSVYEVASATGSGYFDSLVSLIFFLLIGKWFQQKTYESMSFDRDYKSYFPLAVLKMVGKAFEPTMVKDLLKGDELKIRNKEVVPCDSILIEDSAMIDYSFVTGESVPVEKHKGELIYAGGKVVGKQARFIAQKVVSQSYLTSLWNEQSFTKDRKSKRLVDQVSQYFTIIIIAVASVAAIYWQMNDSSQTWLVFTAVLIVACPCALALATPFAWGSVVRIFARNSFYLKNPEVIEDLQQVDTIVFDKTGTITEVDSERVNYDGIELSTEEKQVVLTALSSSTHPLSRKVKQFLGASLNHYQLEEFEEVAGKGIEASVNGLKVLLGSASLVGLKAEEKLNASVVHLKIGAEYKGKFLIKYAYRKGLKDVLNALKSRFKFMILSGDNDAERTKLKEIFPDGVSMKFNQSPHSKLAEIDDLQGSGRQVMMLGDGLNDAGALQQSKVGIAVTEDVSMFSPASDAILDARSFGKLSEFLAIAAQAKGIVIVSFVISFMYNIVGLSLAVAGWLTPLAAAILMPVSSISVVLFTTLSMNWLAKKRRL